MMDRTDIHFRELMRLITKKTLLYTEMINVNSIIYSNKNKFLNECQTEEPLALQIGISDTKLIPDFCKIISDTMDNKWKTCILLSFTHLVHIKILFKYLNAGKRSI